VAVEHGAEAARVRSKDRMVVERRGDAVRVGGRGVDVVAPPRAHPDLPRAVAPVPPDLVPLAAVGAGEVVAHREVLDVDARGLEDLDSVAAVLRLLLGGGAPRAGGRAPFGAVDDDLVAVHTSQMKPR